MIQGAMGLSDGGERWKTENLHTAPPLCLWTWTTYDELALSEAHPDELVWLAHGLTSCPIAEVAPDCCGLTRLSGLAPNIGDSPNH